VGRAGPDGGLMGNLLTDIFLAVAAIVLVLLVLAQAGNP
jgi:hypothetical protein